MATVQTQQLPLTWVGRVGTPPQSHVVQAMGAPAAVNRQVKPHTPLTGECKKLRQL